jgi:hypothetical protein
MKINELLSEDAANLVELGDLVRFYKNTYVKAMRAKKNALTYKGQLVFGDGEDGPAIDNAQNRVMRLLKRSDGIEVEIEMDLSKVKGSRKPHHAFSFSSPVDDKSLVFVGYRPEDNGLYMGYDAWIGEEAFNGVWDREFKQATGQEFDDENPGHEHAFSQVWNKFRDEMFFGLLYHTAGQSAEEELVMPGGFFKGIHKSAVFKRLDIIDLTNL